MLTHNAVTCVHVHVHVHVNCIKAWRGVEWSGFLKLNSCLSEILDFTDWDFLQKYFLVFVFIYIYIFDVTEKCLNLKMIQNGHFIKVTSCRHDMTSWLTVMWLSLKHFWFVYVSCKFDYYWANWYILRYIVKHSWYVEKSAI